MPEATRPELFTSPTTGQQRMLETRYDSGAANINPQALQRLFETQKVEDAQRAMSAAIQFQGLRGYQQALQEGKPAAEALTRYGPMMFYSRPQAFGPAMRAITPPTITPYQKAVLAEREKRANQPQFRIVGGAGGVYNPTNQSFNVIQPAPEKPVSAAVERSLPGLPSARVSMTPTQFRSFIQTAPPQVRTNAVNLALQQMLQPSQQILPPAGTNVPVKKRLRFNRSTGEFE